MTRQRARSGGKQAEGVVEPCGDLGERENFHARRGELDG